MEQGIRIPGVSRQELKRIKAMSLPAFRLWLLEYSSQIYNLGIGDCPRHRVTTETSGIKKSKRRGVKAVAKEITVPVIVTEQAEWAQKTEPVSAAQPVAKNVKMGGDRVHNPTHYEWKGEECIYLIRILLDMLINYQEGKEAVAKSKRGGLPNA